MKGCNTREVLNLEKQEGCNRLQVTLGAPVSVSKMLRLSQVIFSITMHYQLFFFLNGDLLRDE